MKYLFLISFMILSIESALSQTIKFGKNDDFRKVHHGDIVEINTDTAFVIDATRAKFINEKLEDLNKLEVTCDNLKKDKKILITQLSKTQKILNKLQVHLKADSTVLNSNLNSLISELSIALESLQQSNKSLDKNNKELQSKIKNLERVIKDLKKETKWLWWNGIMDKVIAFGGGIGIGILLTNVL